MSQDVFKPKGKLKKYEAGAGKAQTQDVPLIATVMNNIDPTNSGRIEVYPSESLDKAGYDKSTWIPVRRLSTFFGSVKPTGGDDELGSYVSNPSSYGQWNSPPDIGTKVLCIFVNGDMNYGFYIGAVADGSELQMVPAIGSSDRVIANEGEAQSYGGATTLPVTNINTNNPDVNDNPDYLQAPKPVHSYSATIMQQQGILRDRIRGPISSSASREASSRVGWGVSTPGRPIYTGGYTDETLPSNLDAQADTLKVVARRGGHSIVMDDGDIIGRDQLIRIRTALGHQILMSDDGQTLMLLHSNGQSYIELGKEGTVDVFATNSINFRTQGDLNLHADNMVNIHAGKDININATENINVNSDKKFMQRVGENYELYSLKDLWFKSDTNIASDAAGKISVKSAGEAYVEGSKIHLNDGSAGITPVKIEPIPIVKHTDTLFDEQTGWSAAPGKLDSITSRAPAHCPWLGAGQGVDVQVDSSADGALPPAPAGNVSELNAQSNSTPGPAGVSDATVASVPEVNAMSKSFDKNTTTTMLGGVATAAATSAAKDAVTKGVATFADATTGKISAAVGSFAQTPSQLASGGILKPGADNMVNTLVSAGKVTASTLSKAMPQSAFTGQDGVNNLTSLTGSVTAQAKSVVNNMQKAQTGLTLAGAITGKEAPGAIGGIVSAAAGGVASGKSLGSQISSTVNLVKDGISTSSVSGSVKNAALGAIKQGTASAVASTLTGGLGGVTKSLDAISKVSDFGNSLDIEIGPVASAFKTITKTFKPMKPNVPIDLTEISKGLSGEIIAETLDSGASAILDLASSKAATEVGAGAVGSALSQATSDVTGAMKDAVGGVTNQLVGAALNQASNTADALGKSAKALTNSNQLASAANQVQKGLSAGAASAAATGLKDLPGGTAIAGAVVNSAKNALNPLTDNLTGVAGKVSDLASKAFSGQSALPTNVPGLSSLGGIANELTKGLPAGAQAAIQSALASLTSGGGSTVKLPTIGVNTFNRASLTSMIDNVLGPSIIPRPNLLGEISSSVLGIADSLLSQQKQLATTARKLSKARQSAAAAQSAYSEALANFPAGSPEAVRAKSAFESAVAQLDSIREELVQLQSTAASPVARATPASAEILKETEQAFQQIENVIETAAASDNSLAVIASNQEAGSNLGQFNYDNNADFVPSSITIDNLGSDYFVNNITEETFTFDKFSNVLVATTFESTPPPPPPPPPDLVEEDDEPVIENTVEAVVGPVPPPNPPPPSPPQGGGGCVVLESYIPAVESALFNGRMIEQAWQLRPDHDIALGKADASLETYIGKIVFNNVELQPCVRLITKSGVSLVCSTTAPIFTKELEFVNAPDLMNKEVACMKNDETFWDEIVSIEDVGEKFVAVINAGDTAFWAGETNESFMLHHNIAKAADGIYYDKK
jgi:hypothetical protein